MRLLLTFFLIFSATNSKSQNKVFLPISLATNTMTNYKFFNGISLDGKSWVITESNELKVFSETKFGDFYYALYQYEDQNYPTHAIVKSKDGISNWENIHILDNRIIYNSLISYSNGLICVGNFGRVTYSADGVVFTTINIGNDSMLKGVIEFYKTLLIWSEFKYIFISNVSLIF